MATETPEMTDGARVPRALHRAVGAVHGLAWLSLGAQVQALFGTQGLLPAAEVLDRVRALELPWWRFPSWLRSVPTDAALTGGVYAGMLCALAALAGVGSRAALAVSLFEAKASFGGPDGEREF